MSSVNLWTSVTDSPFPYLLYRPDDMLARPAARWPLIVFLHGAGHRGANLQSLYAHGLVATLSDLIPLPCFVVAPQCPADTTWGYQLDRLEQFLDHLLAAHPLEPQRISLTGSSMGANGVWCWAKHAPQRFAALAPIAAVVRGFWTSNQNNLTACMTRQSGSFTASKIVRCRFKNHCSLSSECATAAVACV